MHARTSAKLIPQDLHAFSDDFLAVPAGVLGGGHPVAACQDEEGDDDAEHGDPDLDERQVWARAGAWGESRSDEEQDSEAEHQPGDDPPAEVLVAEVVSIGGGQVGWSASGLDPLPKGQDDRDRQHTERQGGSEQGIHGWQEVVMLGPSFLEPAAQYRSASVNWCSTRSLRRAISTMAARTSAERT